MGVVSFLYQNSHYASSDCGRTRPAVCLLAAPLFSQPAGSRGGLWAFPLCVNVAVLPSYCVLTNPIGRRFPASSSPPMLPWGEDWSPMCPLMHLDCSTRIGMSHKSKSWPVSSPSLLPSHTNTPGPVLPRGFVRTGRRGSDGDSHHEYGCAWGAEAYTRAHTHFSWVKVELVLLKGVRMSRMWRSSGCFQTNLFDIRILYMWNMCVYVCEVHTYTFTHTVLAWGVQSLSATCLSWCEFNRWTLLQFVLSATTWIFVAESCFLPARQTKIQSRKHTKHDVSSLKVPTLKLNNAQIY